MLKRAHALTLCVPFKVRGMVDDEEEDEIKRILEDENVQMLDEDERAGLTYLDALTGSPRPNDVLIFALPVCGPVSALNSYK